MIANKVKIKPKVPFQAKGNDVPLVAWYLMVLMMKTIVPYKSHKYARASAGPILVKSSVFPNNIRPAIKMAQKAATSE